MKIRRVSVTRAAALRRCSVGERGVVLQVAAGDTSSFAVVFGSPFDKVFAWGQIPGLTPPERQAPMVRGALASVSLAPPRLATARSWWRS
jgi:hypothetical protein